MVLSDETLTLLVLVSLGLSLLALFILLVTAPRRRIGGHEALSGGGRMQLAARDREAAHLKAAVDRLGADQRRLVDVLRGTVQHVGLVRYDAFEDMGGHLSFSVALLNAEGDGVVITSINGRADTRCYAKPVKAGQSGHNLSEEEETAIRQAFAGTQDSVTAS